MCFPIWREYSSPTLMIRDNFGLAKLLLNVSRSPYRRQSQLLTPYPQPTSQTNVVGSFSTNVVSISRALSSTGPQGSVLSSTALFCTATFLRRYLAATWHPDTPLTGMYGYFLTQIPGGYLATRYPANRYVRLLSYADTRRLPGIQIPR